MLRFQCLHSVTTCLQVPFLKEFLEAAKHREQWRSLPHMQLGPKPPDTGHHGWLHPGLQKRKLISFLACSLFKNFPQFVVTYKVKGFGIIHKAKVDVFLELSYLIQWILAIWSLVPLPFLNPAWTSVSLWVKYCWSMFIYHGKFLKRWEYQATWPASWELCMQISSIQHEF